MRRDAGVPATAKMSALRYARQALAARPQFLAYRVQDLTSAPPLIARHVLRWPVLTWTVRTQRRTAPAPPATPIRSSLRAFGRSCLQLEPPSRVGIVRGCHGSYNMRVLAIAIAGLTLLSVSHTQAAPNQARSIERICGIRAAITDFSAAKRHKKQARKQVRINRDDQFLAIRSQTHQAERAADRLPAQRLPAGAARLPPGAGTNLERRADRASTGSSVRCASYCSAAPSRTARLAHATILDAISAADD